MRIVTARNTSRRARAFAAMLAVLALSGTAAVAATIPIQWIDMSPVLVGNTVPSGSVFNVPGIGNVTLTYTIPANWTRIRQVSASNVSGSVTSGLNTYPWTNYEYFGTIFTDGELGPETATMTYTFPSTLAAQTVFVGTLGLGATTSFSTLR